MIFKIDVLGCIVVPHVQSTEKMKSPEIVEQVVNVGFGVVLVASTAIFLTLGVLQFHNSVAIQVKCLQPPIMVIHGNPLQFRPQLLCSFQIPVHDMFR